MGASPLSPLLLSRQRDGTVIAIWSSVGFFIALLLGFMFLRLPGATIAGNELSVERSVFMVMNAATGTGFQQTTPIDNYAARGQACMIGLMVVGTLFSLVVGGLAVVRVARMPFSDGQVLTAIATWYVLALAVGTALLAEPTFILPAAVQAASAFGNNGMIIGTLPGIMDWRTHAVLMALATIGGLSIPVLLDLTGLAFGRHRMTLHSWVVVGMSALLYLLGMAVCVPWDAISPHSMESWTNALATGSVMSINVRTCGLPLVSLATYSRIAQWLIIGLMMAGGAPGSTAGGLKVTTIYELFRGVGRTLRGQSPGRLFGIAATWFGIYVLIALLTLLALLAMQPELPADRLLFIAISAISGVGLSQDPISVTGGGLIVIAIAMFLGRVVPLAILWWAATTVSDGDLAVG